ncbi:proline-rich p65 protein [Lasius niger]|uniref:Proline-rich p65 protein n=1 Tax=Lasius niger TaxID=67767 RepID=A0A0J7K670_LASNI|nr:proline-rich p65 protein [Lasius niger]
MMKEIEQAEESKEPEVDLPQRAPRERVKPSIKIVENIQLVPPKKEIMGEMRNTKVETRPPEAGLSTSRKSKEWTTVERGSKKSKKARQQQERQGGSVSATRSRSRSKNARSSAAGNKKPNEKKGVRRSLPRTAAVAIKGKGENFSYAAAFKEAGEAISLKDLKIKTSKVRPMGDIL